MSVPMESEFGDQYLELWYGIWRTASGVAVRCSFVPCCGSFLRVCARRVRPVRSAQCARVHSHAYLTFALPSSASPRRHRGRTFYPSAFRPGSWMIVFMTKGTAVAAPVRCAHPAVSSLSSPIPVIANACYVICCRVSFPIHAPPPSARRLAHTPVRT